MRLFIDGQEISAKGASLSINEGFETVRFLDNREPDPTWMYEDAEGHGHFWAETSYGHFWVPTVERVVTDLYWCEDCRDEHEISHLACRDCGEAIQPGTRPGPQSRRIPTTRSMDLTIQADLEGRSEIDVELVGYESLDGRYKGYVTHVYKESFDPVKTRVALYKEN